jgi:hypothetical protein
MAMLWKKPWAPEGVLALIGGVIFAFVFGNVAAGLLHHAAVSGFQREDSVGTVLVATLCFHGAVIAGGTVFLKCHDTGWREALGERDWKYCLLLALAVLSVVMIAAYGLKALSELVMDRLHWEVTDQTAVTMILKAKPWMRAYLAFFAVVLAPVGEEFFFRGLLFSTAKRHGWPKLGWFGVSFVFALFHVSAPIFLSLFVLALALTWLYEKTGGLLAPILAHSLFNLIGVIALVIQLKQQPGSP